MATPSKIRSGIGKLNPFKSKTRAAPSQAAHAQTATITIQQHPVMPPSTTTMSREELKARRIARVEGASNVIESSHVKVMLRFLDGLCLLGPFWILFWTTSEMGQLFTGKAFDIHDQTSLNVYAAALFGECVLAGLTFMWQYADAYARSLEDSAERRQMRGWLWGLSATWFVFAAISALGQGVYLAGVWHASTHNWWAWVLVAGRVSIYTAGEWACAKYLGWRVTTLRRIAQEEKVKGELYKEIEQQEAARIQMEAEADLHLRQVELQMQSAERNARIAGDVQEIMSQSAVKFLGQFTTTLDAVMNSVLNNVNQRLELPPVEGEVKSLEEPTTEDL